MAKKKMPAAVESGTGVGPASDPLLPTVNPPGTYEWCEEVVECMNTAWRARETSEQGFIAAARAALQHHIWETLSPPPPHEPYTSLENLIRRTADEGQAENMQLVIKFSGVLDEVARRAEPPPWDTAGAIAATGARGSQAAAGWAGPDLDGEPGGADASDAEVALGEALLAQFAAQLGVSLDNDEGAPARPVGIPAGVPVGDAGGITGGGSATRTSTSRTSTSAESRASAAQRKRERLERTHPELIDAVEAGEMTLKQAYVEAGIEKQVQTIDKLQKLWRTASEEERERFLSWLDEQIAQQRKRTYQEEVYGDA